MWKSALVLLCFTVSAFAAEKLSAPQLIELANRNDAGLKDAIVASFDAKDLQEGTAWAGHGPDLFFATEAAQEPSLVIDQNAGVAMKHMDGSKLWYAVTHVEPAGRLHAFHYKVNGTDFGGRLDLPVFGPLSYLQ